MFDLILEHVPPPAVDDGPFSMLATTLDADPFLGRILTGRVTSGTVKPNQQLKALDREGKVLENFRVQKVLAFHGLERTPVEIGRRRRHHRARRHEPRQRRRYALRSSRHRTAARAARRSADAVDDVPHQRRPVCRPGRRQGSKPRHPRSPAQGSRAQHRHPHRTKRR